MSTPDDFVTVEGIRAGQVPGLTYSELYGAPQTTGGDLVEDVALILIDCCGVRPDGSGLAVLDTGSARYLASLVIARVLREPVVGAAPTYDADRIGTTRDGRAIYRHV